MKRGLVIGIIIGAFALLAVFTIFIYPTLGLNKSSSNPQDNTLEVKVLGQDGDPIPYMEVNIWITGAGGADPNGEPSGKVTTNKQGIASFTVSKADFLIGFNPDNFPEFLELPEKTPVTVGEGKTQKTIILYAK